MGEDYSSNDHAHAALQMLQARFSDDELKRQPLDVSLETTVKGQWHYHKLLINGRESRVDQTLYREEEPDKRFDPYGAYEALECVKMCIDYVIFLNPRRLDSFLVGDSFQIIDGSDDARLKTGTSLQIASMLIETKIDELKEESKFSDEERPEFEMPSTVRGLLN